MRYSFYNKNTRLFDFNYNEDTESIDKILDIVNSNYMPLNISNFEDDKDLLKKFKIWLNHRYSKNSSWYKKVEWRYGETNIDNNFIIKSYGLSLSDQYWLKPSFAKEKWEDVNFFQNDFKYKAFLDNNMERVYNYNDVDVLYSPNITTGGELDKAWAIEEDGTRVLYKSSNTFLGLEPINEYIASQMCEILDLNHANFTIKILSNLNNKIMVSSCPTFVTPDTELVHADDLIDPSLDVKRAFNSYVRTLESLGIENAKEKIQKMILLDVMLANQDRHKLNFGVIRDVNTLEYIDVAPIYDTGRSMCTYYPSVDDYKENFCLFNVQNATKKDCLDLVEGLALTSDQIDKLLEVPEVYAQTLENYITYTNIREKYMVEDISELKQFLKDNIMDALSFVKERSNRSIDFENESDYESESGHSR